MPSTSAKQHRLMEMVAHDPAAAQRTGVPESVAKDFVKADAGHTFDHVAHHAALKRDARSAPAVRPKSRGNRGSGY